MIHIRDQLTIARRALIVLIGTALTTAFAALPLAVDATAVPFADEPSTVTVDLHLADALVVVLGADGVGIGPVIVPEPELAADANGALDRVPTITALHRSDVIEDVHTGVVYLHDTADVRAVARAYAERLGELGFEVSVDGPILHATNGDLTYRVVVGLDEFDGDHAVRVYVGL